MKPPVSIDWATANLASEEAQSVLWAVKMIEDLLHGRGGHAGHVRRFDVIAGRVTCSCGTRIQVSQVEPV